MLSFITNNYRFFYSKLDTSENKVPNQLEVVTFIDHFRAGTFADWEEALGGICVPGVDVNLHNFESEEQAVREYMQRQEEFGAIILGIHTQPQRRIDIRRSDGTFYGEWLTLCAIGPEVRTPFSLITSSPDVDWAFKTAARRVLRLDDYTNHVEHVRTELSDWLKAISSSRSTS